jgi:hypothetical protein
MSGVVDIHAGERIRAFFDIEANVLYQRYKTIETLLPAHGRRGADHRGEEGRHVESLLRDFLNRHLPGELRAFSGFIVRPATKTGERNLDRLGEDGDRHSTQLDVIVYDQAHYPVYDRFEEFAVVPPEGVVAIISVKKRLYEQELSKEINSLRKAADLCFECGRRGPHLGLFSFTADDGSNEDWGRRIFRAILDVCKNAPFDHIVNEVTILDRLVAFKYAPKDCPPGQARFVRCDRNERVSMHLALGRVLQSILSVYCDRAGISRPGFVSFHKGTFHDAPELGFVPCCAMESTPSVGNR